VWIFALVAEDGHTRLINRDWIAMLGAPARFACSTGSSRTRQLDHGAQDAAAHQAVRLGSGPRAGPVGITQGWDAFGGEFYALAAGGQIIFTRTPAPAASILSTIGT
jgi:hypothetical protein